jgi:hypothetical protein
MSTSGRHVHMHDPPTCVGEELETGADEGPKRGEEGDERKQLEDGQRLRELDRRSASVYCTQAPACGRSSAVVENSAAKEALVAWVVRHVAPR